MKTDIKWDAQFQRIVDKSTT